MFDRIIKAFEKNSEIEKRSPLWDWCHAHQAQTPLTPETLETMAETTLTWGFFWQDTERINRETIISLAEGLGISGIFNPENGTALYDQKSTILNLPNDGILDLINEKIPINLPAFIGGRKITQTKYGIITDRHCHYLWVLKQILKKFPDRKTRILEVGAGLGILGYYLDRAGYYDYTTIDLTYANACQTYFLNRNLPEREIILSGEIDFCNPSTLKLLHASDFKENLSFDLLINIDGLTEMERTEAVKYVKAAKNFLSINHEANDFRVNEIATGLEYRYPFWLRPGYVEELYKQ